MRITHLLDFEEEIRFTSYMTRKDRWVWAFAIAIIIGAFVYLNWDEVRRERHQPEKFGEER